jgi:thiosulfate dehydrogenase
MHRINTAAQFIRANMPLGRGGMLSVQQAWDVAYFVNSHERPQDPRYNGNLAQTNKKYHDHQCRYDQKVAGHTLGMK